MIFEIRPLCFSRRKKKKKKKLLRMKILINGGGVAGLTLAACLRHQARIHSQKLSVEIHERAPAYDKDAGGILSISTALPTILDLGLGDQLKRYSEPLDHFRMFDDRDRLVSDIHMPELLATALGSVPGARELLARVEGSLSWMVRRGDLLQVLTDHLEGDECVQIRMSSAARGYRLLTNERGVAMHLDGDNEVRGDALFGCDGIRSVMRAQMFGAAVEPVYSGQVLRGAVTPLASLPERYNEMRDALTQVMGSRGVSFLAAPACGGADAAPAIGWGLTSTEPLASNMTESWDRDSGRPLIDQCLAIARDSSMPQSVIELIDASDSFALQFPLFYRPVVTRPWHDGRCMLLGDSAHATEPYAGQGANSAMIDAAVIAVEMIGKASPPPPTTTAEMTRAFARVQERRQTNVKRMVTMSHMLGVVLHSRNSLVCAIRDKLYPLVFSSPISLKAALRDTFECIGILDLEPKK
jgi:2-polyprenyl-6-methoxyphenol hydroxylase-like FAD-dependent oxidoreductase